VDIFAKIQMMNSHSIEPLDLISFLGVIGP
jgi:hypothetical protein